MDLEKRFHKALCGLYMLQHGGTIQTDKDIVHGSRDKGGRPAGESEPPYEEFVRRWERAFSHSSRLAIVEEAERDLTNWKITKGSDEPEYGSVQWKRMIANSDKTPTELARLHSVSRQSIYTYIQQYRKDAA